MGKLKNFLRIGILGSILGALGGLFFAKKKGSDTRREVREKIEETKEKLLAGAKKAAREFKEMKDEIASEAKEIKKDFRDIQKEGPNKKKKK